MTRHEANLKIIALLTEYADKWPDLRFHQESSVVLDRIEKTIKFMDEVYGK